VEFIVDGWMQARPDGRLELLGRQCEECGVAVFPPTAHCSACASDRVREIALGPEAELHSITVDRMGTFIGRPHLVGQVRFDQGPFVQGFIDEDMEHPPPVGATVELVPFELLDGDEPVLTYAFRVKEA
jgi:uncharacterized OB-fold protein